MNEINFGVMSNGEIQGEKLAELASVLSQKIGTWQKRRRELDDKLSRIIEVRATHFEEGKPLNGAPSWIGKDSFADVEDCLHCVDALRKERLALPILGLELIRECEAVRTATAGAFTASQAAAGVALAKATAAAQHQAEKLRLSQKIQAVFIEEATESERMATAGRNPCPPDWYGWSEKTLQTAERELVVELREAFVQAV